MSKPATSYSEICKMPKVKQWEFLQFTNSTRTSDAEIMAATCPLLSCAASPGSKCHSPLGELSEPHKSRRIEMLAKRWLDNV